MYRNFYNLSENPFNLTPDPKFHYVNESTREALAALLYGIEARKGIITLVGDAGTGKTTLLKRVFETVQGESRMVFVFNPGVSFDELLEFICLDLGIRTDNSRRLHLLDRLNRYLLEQLTEGHNVVVMIDEAQTLNDETLEQLRLLTNLETSKEKTLQIVLSGQTELEEKLRKPGMRQLRQRIGAHAMLRPMERGEIGAYVETRLTSAGASDPNMFGPGALKRIWRASGGIARVVNVICDSALVIGFAKGEKQLSTETVKEAIRDLTGEGRVPGLSERLRAWLGRPVLRYLAATTAALAIATPLALLLLERAADLDPGFRRTASVEGTTEPDTPLPSTTGAQRPVPEPTAAPVAAEQGPVTAQAPPRPDQRPSQSGLSSQGPSAARPPESEPVAAAKPETSLGAVSDRVGAGTSAPVPRAVVAAAEPVAVPEPVEPAERPAAPPDGIVEDTIRRAEILARSAAARLYREEREPAGASTSTGVRATAPEPAAPESPALQPAAPEPTVARRETPVEEPVERVAAPSSPGPSARAPEPPRKARAAEAKAPVARTEPKPRVAAPTPARRPEPKPAAVAAAPARRPEPKPAAVAAAPARRPQPEPRKPTRAAGTSRRSAKAAPASPSAVRAPSATGRIFGWQPGEPPVGRLVPLRSGDTLRKVATRYYPDAGSATVDALLARSPGLDKMGVARGGSFLLLPFLTAQEMVVSGSDGTYRVLLARAPSRRQTEATADWARVAVPKFRLLWESPSSSRPAYSLYAVGFSSRNDALAAADYVLFKLAELQASRLSWKPSRSSGLASTTSPG